MPWDVSTRWNSTYDMLKFACTYREAIDKITDDRSMKLRDYELKDGEWKIIEELRDTLKVCFFFFSLFLSRFNLHLDIQNSNAGVLKRHTMHRERDSCHGSNAH